MIDSSVWIDFFRGVDNAQSDRLDQSLGQVEVVTGDLILTEVLQGFRSDRDYRTARRLFRDIPTHRLLGHDMALKSADNFRTLRKRGITVRKTADVIIASYCIAHRIPLLFSDRDFQPFVKHLGLLEA